MIDVKDNIIFLKAIASLPKQQAIGILKCASSPQVIVICQIAKNVLANNLKIKEKYKGILKRQRNVIRSLAQSKLSHKKRSALIANNTLSVISLVQAVIDTLKALTK